MRKSWFSEEQIIGVLREQDAGARTEEGIVRANRLEPGRGGP